jgi:hypothetical protein
MNRKKRRAVAAVANGRQALGQIARRAGVSKSALAKWINDPELSAQIQAQYDVDDFWLRARIRGLMPRALKALGRILDSPNTPWRAKAWAITTVFRLNGYLDGDRRTAAPRVSTARRNVVELNGLLRGRRGRMARRFARSETPPVQSLPG